MTEDNGPRKRGGGVMRADEMLRSVSHEMTERGNLSDEAKHPYQLAFAGSPALECPRTFLLHCSWKAW